MFPPSFLPSFPHRLLHSHIAQGDSLPLSSCGVVTRYFCLRRLSRLSPSCPIVLRVSLSFPAARYVGIVIILPPISPLSLSPFFDARSGGGTEANDGGRRPQSLPKRKTERRHCALRRWLFGCKVDVSQTFCGKRGADKILSFLSLSAAFERETKRQCREWCNYLTCCGERVAFMSRVEDKRKTKQSDSGTTNERFACFYRRSRNS